MTLAGYFAACNSPYNWTDETVARSAGHHHCGTKLCGETACSHIFQCPPLFSERSNRARSARIKSRWTTSPARSAVPPSCWQFERRS